MKEKGEITRTAAPNLQKLVFTPLSSERRFTPYVRSRHNTERAGHGGVEY